MTTESEISTLSKVFNKSWTMTMQPLHWACMCYYARRRGQRRSELIRELLETVMRHDKNFDPKAFRDYVLNELISEESDKEAREVLQLQVEEFVKLKLKKSK